MKIPYESLAPETLEALVEAFVLQEGADHSDTDFSLADKVQQVVFQLRREEAVIVFDPVTESCNIVSSRDYVPDPSAPSD